MKFGLDRLLSEPALRAPLAGRRVALLAHPASVTAHLHHSLDALDACPDLTLSAAFGPQHGMKGDLQDNMMETPDETDPIYQIPVFSLYGEVRRPTAAAMETFDVILIDLQDLGCRIYTFITTLLYVIEAAAEHGKSVWVLDRPNPAGRPVDFVKDIQPILEQACVKCHGPDKQKSDYRLDVKSLALTGGEQDRVATVIAAVIVLRPGATLDTVVDGTKGYSAAEIEAAKLPGDIPIVTTDELYATGAAFTVGSQHVQSHRRRQSRLGVTPRHLNVRAPEPACAIRFDPSEDCRQDEGLPRL